MNEIRFWLQSYLWDDNPTLRFYFLAYFLLGMNLGIFFVYGPLFLPMMGFNEISGVSLLIAIPAFSGLLGQNFWGAICLKKDRFKVLLLIGSVSFAPLFILMSFSVEVHFLFIYLAIHGFLLGAFHPSSQTLGTLLRGEAKGEIVAKFLTYESAGWALACFSMACISSLFPLSKQLYSSFFLGLALINIAVVSYLAFHFPGKTHGLDWTQIQPGLKRAYGRLLKSPAVLSLFVYVIFVETGGTMFFFFFSRYFKEILNGTEAILGYAITLCTILGILVLPVVGKLSDKKGYFSILMFSAISYLVVFSTLFFISHPILVSAIYALPVYPLIAVSSNAGIASLTTQEERAIGFGLLESMFRVATLLSPLAGGMIISSIGLEHLPLLSLGFISLGVLFLPIMSRCS